MKGLTERLKRNAKDFGANIVGIADAALYGDAPEGHKPEDILRGAKCVISLGFLQPNTIIEKAMPTQYTRNIFTIATLSDQVANQVTLWLEDQGYEAIPISSRGMYMDALIEEFRGDISHKHSAVLAGLGEMGINTLLINPEFGNRLLLSSVVTNAPLTPDQPFSGELCGKEKCLRCVEACPVKAISPNGSFEKVKCAKHYKRHEEIFKETWGLYYCRECRKVCPSGFPKRYIE